MSNAPLISRRAAMQLSARMALAAMALPAVPAPVVAARKGKALFTLGVASGEPMPTGVVLWTRLAPDPLDPQALGRDNVAVDWQVAEDEGMQKIVARGAAVATPQRAHSVHAEVGGLQPGRDYWYRFTSGGEESAVGRTRTAPPADASLEALRFAFCSCAEYEEDLYHAYHYMAADRPDFILHLGDYIYEKTYLACTPVTKARCLTRREEAYTLDQYRVRYAEHKLDPSLQRAHQAAPWIVTWDDHEVANDYAGTHPEGDRLRSPERIAEFARRRAMAYQAYFENMPLRAASRPNAKGEMQLFRRFDFGTLLRLHVLDERQYRTDHACPLLREQKRDPSDVQWKGRGGGQLVRPDQCDGLDDPRRTMLGRRQEQWLAAGLTGAPRTRWHVLAQGVPFAPLDYRRHGVVMRSIDKSLAHAYAQTDNWSGYPLAREQLLRTLADSRVQNPLILSGDIHAFFANQVWRDLKAQKDPAAVEFVVGSVSSFIGRNLDLDPAARAEENKGTVRFYEGGVHGYALAEVKPDAARVSFLATSIRDKAKAAEPASWERKVIGRFEVAGGSRTLKIIE